MEFKKIESGAFKKWEKIGDEVTGILTDVEERDDSMHPGEKQKVYTLTLEDGTEILIGGRTSIDRSMRKVVKGQWVKLKYEKDIPSKDPTKKANPFKLIEVYEGEVDPEYKNKDNDEIPFV